MEHVKERGVHVAEVADRELLWFYMIGSACVEDILHWSRLSVILSSTANGSGLK